MSENKHRIKVLNIIGWGRSGSTILGSVLGQCEGFFFGGEIKNLWKKSLLNDALCGCKVNVKECELWNKILDDAFGGIKNINAKKILKDIESTVPARYALIKDLPNGENYFKSKSELLDHLKKLYQSIQSNTNCKVIVDATKTPMYSYLLSLIEEIDVHIIHIVRDPRGVAYSRKKKMVQPDKTKEVYLHQYNPLVSSIQWDLRNVLSENLWEKNKSRYFMLRYEDFIKEPRKSIEEILNFTGCSGAKTPFISENTLELKANHSVWGNPSRFKTGQIELKADSEWEKKLNVLDKTISTVTTFPLLVKYKYKMFSLLIFLNKIITMTDLEYSLNTLISY